jgi:hypothetical protein
LAEAAERDGVSLNTFVNVALARAVGAQEGEAAADRTYPAATARYARVAESHETEAQE